MAKWLHARTVVEDKAVSKAASGFEKKFDRFEEAFDALKWLLARKCDSVKSGIRTVERTTYYLYQQASDPLAETPSIIVLYTFDDNEVRLIAINAEKTKSDANTIEDDL